MARIKRTIRAGLRGFTIIELLIVIAVLTIIAALAIPKMLSARMAANEVSAIATLKAIVSSQAQIQARGVIDTDGDGAGEFGYLGELTGTAPARISAGGSPAAGTPGIDELEPSPLLASLASITNGQAEHSGYLFQIWLPAVGGGGEAIGLPEDPTGGKLGAPFPDSDFGEQMFCAYAWPRSASNTGQAAFFVNQEGLILRTFNRGPAAYTGTTNVPAFDAVFAQPTDMSSPLGIHGLVANDGNLWVAVQ